MTAEEEKMFMIALSRGFNVLAHRETGKR